MRLQLQSIFLLCLLTPVRSYQQVIQGESCQAGGRDKFLPVGFRFLPVSLQSLFITLAEAKGFSFQLLPVFSDPASQRQHRDIDVSWVSLLSQSFESQLFRAPHFGLMTQNLWTNTGLQITHRVTLTFSSHSIFVFRPSGDKNILFLLPFCFFLFSSGLCLLSPPPLSPDETIVPSDIHTLLWLFTLYQNFLCD